MSGLDEETSTRGRVGEGSKNIENVGKMFLIPEYIIKEMKITMLAMRKDAASVVSFLFDASSTVWKESMTK